MFGSTTQPLLSEQAQQTASVVDCAPIRLEQPADAICSGADIADACKLSSAVIVENCHEYRVAYEKLDSKESCEQPGRVRKLRAKPSPTTQRPLLAVNPKKSMSKISLLAQSKAIKKKEK